MTKRDRKLLENALYTNEHVPLVMTEQFHRTRRARSTARGGGQKDSCRAYRLHAKKYPTVSSCTARWRKEHAKSHSQQNHKGYARVAAEAEAGAAAADG